jgi:hypothetical protein
MSRQELPRTYELRDLIKEPNAPSAYFQNFDNSLRDESTKKRVWLNREMELQGLDPNAWDQFKGKVESSNYLTVKQKLRGWEQFIGLLNEVRGYNYLKSLGCFDIQFIPETKSSETPELKGKLPQGFVLCEVKTLNISEEESDRRSGLGAGEVLSFLPDGFLNKLRSAIDKAHNQCLSLNLDARHIVYININFDDLLAEYKGNYYKQIDQYLEDYPITDIEIVFHNEQGVFPCQVSMKNATVINEG